MGKKNMYWGKPQEEALVKFQQTANQKTYKEIVEPAFKELVKNIYFTYNFNKILRDHEATQHEALCFLYEKIHNFDHTTGAKAFSYFGTVAKNWMIQQSNKAKKNIYIDDDDQMIHMHKESMRVHKNLAEDKNNKELIIAIQNFLMTYSEEVKIDKDDKIVIEIVFSILENYKNMDIYNKKQLYVFVKEASDLPARKITNTLNKLRIMYDKLKEDYHS